MRYLIIPIGPTHYHRQAAAMAVHGIVSRILHLNTVGLDHSSTWTLAYQLHEGTSISDHPLVSADLDEADVAILEAFTKRTPGAFGNAITAALDALDGTSLSVEQATRLIELANRLQRDPLFSPYKPTPDIDPDQLRMADDGCPHDPRSA